MSHTSRAVSDVAGWLILEDHRRSLCASPRSVDYSLSFRGLLQGSFSKRFPPEERGFPSDAFPVWGNKGFRTAWTRSGTDPMGRPARHRMIHCTHVSIGRGGEIGKFPMMEEELCCISERIG